MHASAIGLDVMTVVDGTVGGVADGVGEFIGYLVGWPELGWQDDRLLSASALLCTNRYPA